MTPEDNLAGDELETRVPEAVRSALAGVGPPLEARATKSHVAFRRRRGFAYLWLPERYLGARGRGIVVVSIALGRRDGSPRWKQVVRPSPRHWMHHLEVRDPAEIDAEVVGWLLEAAERAG